MAETIQKELGIEVEFIKSGGGVFEVRADGKLIFSKKKEYRFPEHREIMEILRRL